MASPSPSPPDQWLRTSDIMRDYRIGKTRVYQLVKSGAWPVSRPFGTAIYAKRSDVDKFFASGYPKNETVSH